MLVSSDGERLESGELFVLIEVRKLFGVLRITVCGQEIIGVCLGVALSDMCFALVLGHFKFFNLFMRKCRRRPRAKNDV